ncbi:hypothetical protein AB0L82_25035 [Nocardia sp. NPDC052001]|uniref:hypothetical protein n=1 Tax=Nocardia sp. NPDC052001 TaxID=3154853 RepID=UPI003420D80E
MRFGGQPSDEQLRARFDSMLERVLAGKGTRTDSGLDREVVIALRAISQAHPNASPDLVAKARAAFADQLSGANAAARHAEMDRIFNEHD